MGCWWDLKVLYWCKNPAKIVLREALYLRTNTFLADIFPVDAHYITSSASKINVSRCHLLYRMVTAAGSMYVRWTLLIASTKNLLKIINCMNATNNLWLVCSYLHVDQKLISFVARSWRLSVYNKCMHIMIWEQAKPYSRKIKISTNYISL